MDKSDVKLLPESPGVYIFRNKNKTPIYIGKAKNLKSRVSSYFLKLLEGKTKSMVSEAKFLDHIKVNSEFEAILLEAKLVRTHMPHYNIELKDDKTPLYIVITKDTYPRVVLVRKTSLTDENEFLNVYGPFTSGLLAKKILRSIRRIVPFSDHKVGKRACIYNELGLCVPCPSVINSLKDDEIKDTEKRKYLKNIRRLKKILGGEIINVKKDMVKDMNQLAKDEKYEEAQRIKEQLSALEFLTTQNTLPELYIKDPNLLEDIRSKEKEELIDVLSPYLKIDKLNRVECFDVAHLAGSFPTASMVTFVDGEPEKKLYRHFKITSTKKSDDLSSMNEILARRFKKLNEWGIPDLVIIDGGKTQLKVALNIIPSNIPVIGLAKRYETIVVFYENKYIEILLSNGHARNFMQRIRNEAHRFARRLHHRLIEKSLLENHTKDK